MKITFLGTNGWYDTDTGNTICVLAETEKYNLILDAGNGISKVDKYADLSKETFIFISHLHLDHISGLHTLAKNSFEKGLKLIVDEEMITPLLAILNQPYTIPFDKLPFETGIISLPADIEKPPFKLEYLPMRHSTKCIGVRARLEGLILSYTGDTGFCDNAVTLGENADILITECAFPPGISNENWPHLNPEMAAEIALKAGAKKLLLTHFEAKSYDKIEKRKEAEIAAQKIFPASQASYDGTVVR